MTSDSKAPVTDERAEELSKIINSFIDVPATEPTRFNEFFHSLEALLASRALEEAKWWADGMHPLMKDDGSTRFSPTCCRCQRIAALEQAAASTAAGGGQ